MIKSEKGMTVLELLFVLLVAAALAALGTPWILTAIQSYRVRTAAWEVAGDLRLARQKAVSLHQRHRICFANCASAVPTGGYLMEREDSTAPPPGWVLALTRNDLPNGVGFTSNQDAVTYNSKGDATIGATITLTNNIGTYIVVAAPSGRVRACKGTICPP